MDDARQRLLQAQVDHAKRRRALQPGDVLDDGHGGTLTITEVRCDHPGAFVKIDEGYAWVVSRGVGQRARVEQVRLRALYRRSLVDVGQPVGMTEPEQHAAGVRRPRPGDVFDEHRFRMTVISVDGSAATVSWHDSGRTSTRSIRRFKQAKLVKWEPLER